MSKKRFWAEDEVLFLSAARCSPLAKGMLRSYEFQLILYQERLIQKHRRGISVNALLLYETVEPLKMEIRELQREISKLKDAIKPFWKRIF